MDCRNIVVMELEKNGVPEHVVETIMMFHGRASMYSHDAISVSGYCSSSSSEGISGRYVLSESESDEDASDTGGSPYTTL